MTPEEFTKHVGAPSFSEAVDVTFRTKAQDEENIESMFNQVKALSAKLAASEAATAQAERERDEAISALDDILNESAVISSSAQVEKGDFVNLQIQAEHYESGFKIMEKTKHIIEEARRERDGRETDLMIALKDLATETAKNAELQGYVRKLAYFLGCKDDEDSPELGIKGLIADRAALREKLAKAGENHESNLLVAIDEVTGHGGHTPSLWRIEEFLRACLAALRGNDKAEKGAGE